MSLSPRNLVGFVARGRSYGARERRGRGRTPRRGALLHFPTASTAPSRPWAMPGDFPLEAARAPARGNTPPNEPESPADAQQPLDRPPARAGARHDAGAVAAHQPVRVPDAAQP